MLGGATRHLLPSEFQPVADAAWERLHRGDSVRNLEAAVKTKAGATIPVLVTSFLLKDEDDQPIATASILKDITTLKQATGALEQRNRELQQFVRAVSHDLGGPLASIGAFARLLQEADGLLRDHQAREYVQSILHCVSRADGLIDDLLEYSRLEASAQPAAEPVDSDRSLKQAQGNLQAAIRDSGAVITSEPLPTVMGHPAQLMQVFQNLIGNAIKFRSLEPPRIHVAAEKCGETWHFTISDNGIGIDPKYHDRIFGVFQRLHSPDKYPGSGVGLAACKHIVERHGGRIWVESQPGRGSVFHFTIPVERSQTPTRM
jgi:light-regulated signal transduction histidine kinase (bacteriophytochrome)